MTVAIKEKPILFSAEMVRAIMNSAKTMTRRIVKGCVEEAGEYSLEKWERGCFPKCPYGEVGQRLWVREAFCLPNMGDTRHDKIKGWSVFYRADCGKMIHRDCSGFTVNDSDCKWRPSIHMFRWACRLTLEITGVRVERLQEITEQDCWSEGIEEVDGALDDAEIIRMAKVIGCSFEDAKPTFATLWNSINGVGSWESNPWVWVIAFKKLEAVCQN